MFSPPGEITDEQALEYLKFAWWAYTYDFATFFWVTVFVIWFICELIGLL